MQIVRTIVWVLLLVALIIFSVANWNPLVTVSIWENLVVETKVPVIVIASFLIAFVPMWLIQLGMKWNHRRQMSGLENKLNSANAVIAQMTAASLPHEVEPAPEIIEVGPDAPPIVVEHSEEPLVDAPAPILTDPIDEPRQSSTQSKFIKDNGPL